jgi:hypothetical protein
MAGYKWDGKPEQRDTTPAPVKLTPAPVKPRPARVPVPRPRVFDPSKCGTHAGYKQHRRYGTDVCDACRAANSAYHRAWRAANPKEPVIRPDGRFSPGHCGTPQGYQRHLRAGTPTCVPCRAAHTERHRGYRTAKAAA